ncbi:LOW QUALITY PROTEIN: pentatricopeptide repeat-containing protein At2g36240-like [Dioscorea cayenensis subsp. rotundata]|uniref:LOW QUALITY PROTEIN: pentatricopeptide repeat-containing protein At2g36240-like n=1 Tax=Dioscorea cayennensis subsp. rotundata TaxID=55577 RepID=A0AB40CYS4_DIOCR|nr:LOW QUALITY PROTEIN: pentatricopeptide repeat-containing protein At2g36240-like [Dioscorea cayenensis subsp. rotundata]
MLTLTLPCACLPKRSIRTLSSSAKELLRSSSSKTPLSEPPPDALPTQSLSPAPPAHFAQFLKTHAQASPSSLLRRILHHPRLRPYDLHLFNPSSSSSSFSLDHSTYELMARSLAASNRLDSLLLLLRHPCPCSDSGIFSCSRAEPIFRLSLLALLRASRLNDAESLFHTLKKSLDSSRPPADLYNILINGFSKHSLYDKALQWYHTMLKDRVKPDTYTFNILISCCCRTRSFDNALTWFKAMRAQGCDPNVVTFNTLISGFFKEKRYKEGIGVAREILDLGHSFSVATCEILVKGLCGEGKEEEACELMKEFVKRGAVPDGFEWLELIERLCRKDKAGIALKVFDEMWERGRGVSAVACSALMEGLRSVGRNEEACGVMERMMEKGMVPDLVTCNCVLEGLCDAGKTKDANRLRVLAMRKGLKPDGVTFSILIRGFSREGMRREGEELVNEMLDAGFIGNIAGYNQLMKWLQNGGR